jgi:hypothetical protein
LIKKNTVKIIIIFLILAFVMISINAYFSINGFYKDVIINKISISMTNVKTGLEKIETKTIETKDQEQIKEIVGMLKNSLLFKTFPSVVGDFNSNDRVELRMILTTNTEKYLEYDVTSDGTIKIIKDGYNSFFNTILVGDNPANWFAKIKSMFDENVQNEKWIQYP